MASLLAAAVDREVTPFDAEAYGPYERGAAGEVLAPPAAGVVIATRGAAPDFWQEPGRHVRPAARNVIQGNPMASPLPRLLLVDDEADILDTVRDLLEFAVPGVEVVTARNGLEALERLQGQAFDAVLTDYRMPGMDGAELVQAIRTNRPDLPIVMFTAYVDQGLLKKLHAELPGLEIIPKPVVVDEFVPRIRKLMEEAQAPPK